MRTRLMGAAAALAVFALAGCELLDRVTHSKRPAPAPATFSQFHQEGWQWDRVGRVVVLPFRNESKYTHAAEETREAIVAELQRVGRFEVIPTAPDDRAFLAAEVRCGGRFDELMLLELARLTSADVIIHGTVSEYSPYPRPRLGIVIQAVGPQAAKIVASVDGLWDTTDLAIADRVRVYYRQTARERPPWIRNHVIANDDSFASDLSLDSPTLFRRFVSREAVLALLGMRVPGVVVGGGDGAGVLPENGKVGCAPPPVAPGAQVAPATGTPK